MEYHLFSQYRILPQVEICVVIPVKNEEKHILQTLTALSRQVNIEGSPFNFEICEILILANNCTDRSAEIIKEFQKENTDLKIYLEEILLPKNKANIGYVRKTLFDTAFYRLSKNKNGIIMTTDGDTTVSPDWIMQNIQEINCGADAVGGRILLCPKEIPELNAQTYSHHLKDEKYQLLLAELEGKILQDICDPSPRHHQHFNGSFAITKDCYLKSGGVPAVTYLEDMAFFERLKLIDAKVRHSNKVVVHTSARCIGRTEFGLSYQLNRWENSGICNAHFFVESCSSILERLKMKKQLMNLWEDKNLIESEYKTRMETVLPETIIDSQNYNDFLNCTYFGEWYSKFSETIKLVTRKHPPELIDEAILNLEEVTGNYSESSFSQTSMR